MRAFTVSEGDEKLGHNMTTLFAAITLQIEHYQVTLINAEAQQRLDSQFHHQNRYLLENSSTCMMIGLYVYGRNKQNKICNEVHQRRPLLLEGLTSPVDAIRGCTKTLP